MGCVCYFLTKRGAGDQTLSMNSDILNMLALVLRRWTKKVTILCVGSIVLFLENYMSNYTIVGEKND